MSILSKTCIYGIRAALYVAVHGEPEKYVSIRNMAQELGISFHFLTKILQQLTQQRLMTSYRGPHGGVALARAPSEVTVLDVVHALDGEQVLRSCILGLSDCGSTRPCPLHEAWARERSRLERLFSEMTLARLAHGVESAGLRLAD